MSVCKDALLGLKVLECTFITFLLLSIQLLYNSISEIVSVLLVFASENSMSDSNKKQDNKIPENEEAKTGTSSTDAAGRRGSKQKTSDGENIEILEEKENKVERETQKNARDVSKVRDELKRERQFNSYVSWLAVINFALLVLLIMGIYIYESSNNAKIKTRMFDIRTGVQRTEDRLQSLSEFSKADSIRIQNLANQVQEEEDRILALDKQLGRIQSRVDTALEQISSAPAPEQKPAIKLTDPETLLLNEAHYLLKQAYRKVYLEHDVAVAVTLLRDADQVLAEVDDPNIIAVRKGVATDITKLSSLEPVDSETLVIRLSAMEENIKNLPVLGYKVNFNGTGGGDDISEPAEVTDNIADWKDNLFNSMNSFFGSLMVIKKNTSGHHQFLSADEVAILQDKITLILMQAQLAVYSQQQTAYEQNLIRAAALIEEYCDKEDASTIQVLNEINSLQSQSVIFIGVQQFESLNQLREFYKKSGR